MFWRNCPNPAWFQNIAARIDRLDGRLDRLERKIDKLFSILTQVEREVNMAYEAELAALAAQAKANEDQEDSAVAVLAKLADIIAALKTTQTDPATAKAITDLAASLKTHADPLGAAIAASPQS